MAVAVDSSVLLAIFKAEADGDAWLQRLAGLRASDPLVACEVVWAEIAPAFPNLDALKRSMADLGVGFASLDLETAFHSGRLFNANRREGGPRKRVLPDFMIAAHAILRTRGLATNDDGYHRTCFGELRVFGLEPTD